MTEVSSTRLYLGNLPRNATKADVEAHFASHGTGDITEIKLMNGFGFIEYKDAMDARDVVPAFHGSTFMGERLTVQFARGSRHRENGGPGGPGGFASNERAPPRPRRTPHRMQISGLPTDTSWQDLKDFARQSGCDVVYSETGRNSNGEGFVEFETAADLKKAVEALDGREFKDQRVTCVANTQPDLPPRDGRGRSRSPGARRPYPPREEFMDRRGPPGGWSPRRDYRDRSPPRRDYYEDRARYRMDDYPPPRRGPMDDYPPPRRGRMDDYPPPRRGPVDDYPPPPRDFPPREAGYPRESGYYPPRDYDRRYW